MKGEFSQLPSVVLFRIRLACLATRQQALEIAFSSLDAPGAIEDKSVEINFYIVDCPSFFGNKFVHAN